MSFPSELAVSGSSVPTGYAEKAMASLMQLHSELMDEKEKRVELFRRLMEKEQALAELKMYVKLLEEKAAAAMPQPPPREPLKVAPRPAQTAPSPVVAPPLVPTVTRTAPVVRQVATPPSRPVPDGWKTW